AGLLCIRTGQPSETVAVQATTVNGEHDEDALCLERAWVEVREVLDEAQRDADHYEDDWRDHMPNRPELFDIEYHDHDPGEKTYSYVEDYDEAEDRRVALDIIRTL